MKNTRVVIVDDELHVREGLEAWLSNDYLTQCYTSAESFLEAIHDFEFEDNILTCLLLDFQMPGMNGVELQTVLKQINIAFPIIFMSGNAMQEDVINAWRGGAIDFILKPFTAQQVSDCLTKAFVNAEKAINSLANQPDPSASDPSEFNPASAGITQREAQVLMLLGKGYQQTEVADKLGISLRTVKMYRTFLKNKLHLNTLMALGRYYDRHQVAIEKIAGEFQN
jgi:FixJ family two-component response regulator